MANDKSSDTLRNLTDYRSSLTSHLQIPPCWIPCDAVPELLKTLWSKRYETPVKKRKGGFVATEIQNKAVALITEMKHGGKGEEITNSVEIAVLASRDASMVVKKKYSSTFRDDELAAAKQHYRAYMGWKMRDKPGKVGTGVTVCCLYSYDGHGRRGCTFSGRIIGTKTKRNERVHIIVKNV